MRTCKTEMWSWTQQKEFYAAINGLNPSPQSNLTDLSNQSDNVAFLHAMRSEGDSHDTAMNKFKQYLKDCFYEFLFRYNEYESLMILGFALHGIVDSFTPSHHGFQHFASQNAKSLLYKDMGSHLPTPLARLIVAANNGTSVVSSIPVVAGLSTSVVGPIIPPVVEKTTTELAGTGSLYHTPGDIVPFEDMSEASGYVKKEDFIPAWWSKFGVLEDNPDPCLRKYPAPLYLFSKYAIDTVAKIMEIMYASPDDKAKMKGKSDFDKRVADAIKYWEEQYWKFNTELAAAGSANGIAYTQLTKAETYLTTEGYDFLVKPGYLRPLP